MKTYRIHLIRHGLTEGNKRGQFIGSTDLPVAKEGLAELEKLKKTYQYPEVHLFFCSPLKRCKQTLKFLYGDVNPQLVKGLSECDMGDFEGKTGEELKEDPRFIEWIEGRSEGPPGGETNQQFGERCVTAFHTITKTLLSAGEQEAVICTHGGVIMTILAACGLPEKPAADWVCGNGQGYTLRITPGVWMRGGKVEIVRTLPVGMDPKIQFGGKILDFSRGNSNTESHSE